MLTPDIAIEQLAYVEAVVNYVKPTPDKPRSYAFILPPGDPRANALNDPHTVRIRDMRPIAEDISLDRQGFALRSHRSAVTDFADEDELRHIYYPEVERLIAQATGGKRVVTFDHTIRRRVRGLADRTAAAPRQPSTQIHGDYSAASGPQRLRDVLGKEAEVLLKQRFAIVNAWRPIRGPLRDAPLAMCDVRSVAPGDLVAADLIYRDRNGENYLMRYRPGHRWFYAPDMSADEVMLLKCYNSAEDGRSRFVPHTSFDDPTAPPDILPRESIELRTFVFY
jgi:hypothetical protein